MTTWEPVKRRTAAEGAVWRSPDGLLYKRTGGDEVREEAEFLRMLTDLGYPVPPVVSSGIDGDGRHFFVERSAGVASLHDRALDDVGRLGHVGSGTVTVAAEVSGRLLKAQMRNPLPTSTEAVRSWFHRAGHTAEVFSENPDLDTARTNGLIERAIGRLVDVPMCHSNMDYGLPNAFPDGVIDWQHHGPAPLGYDVYPMLEIVAFKRGSKGYRFGADQRARYIAALDELATSVYGSPLRMYSGDFLLAKCFFFLARMHPADPVRRPDKHLKWRYRRTLFEAGLRQYELSATIDTAVFPIRRTVEADHSGENPP